MAHQAGAMFAKRTSRFIVLVDIQRREKSMTVDHGTTEENCGGRGQIRLRLGRQFLSNALAILLFDGFTFDRPIDPWLSLDKIVLLLGPKRFRSFFQKNCRKFFAKKRISCPSKATRRTGCLAKLFNAVDAGN